MEDSEFIFPQTFPRKGAGQLIRYLFYLIDNALTISIQAPFFSQDQSLHDVDST